MSDKEEIRDVDYGPRDLLIFDHCDPVYDAGTEIKLEARQLLLEGGDTRLDARGEVHLRVVGPRVRLDPGAVLGVFPAPQSEDSPDDFLPHVVLARRTLPWERVGPAKGAPWLAVLLLDESELIAEDPRQPTRSMSVKDARAAHAELALEGVDDQLELELVDLPAQLAAKILPRPHEYALLCHMRRLISDTPLRELDDDGDVAVVLGCRLPAVAEDHRGRRHHAFLVSVEGRGDLDDGQAGSGPKGSKPVVVLHRWSFVTGAGDGFEEVIQSLRYRPNGGVLGFGTLPREQEGSLETLVGPQGDLIEAVPFPQDPRGLAGYRGPLSRGRPRPYSSVYAVRPAPGELNNDLNNDLNGDEMPSEPASLGDLAAFELGRLLALADSGVLAALQRIVPVFVPKEVPTKMLVDLLSEILKPWEAVSNPWTHPFDKWEDIVLPSIVEELEQLAGLKGLGPSEKLGKLGKLVGVADIGGLRRHFGPQLEQQLEQLTKAAADQLGQELDLGVDVGLGEGALLEGLDQLFELDALDIAEQLEARLPNLINGAG